MFSPIFVIVIFSLDCQFSRLTAKIGVFFWFYLSNSQFTAKMDEYFWRLKVQKKWIKSKKCPHFGHMPGKLAPNLKMNIMQVISSSVRPSPRVHSTVVHQVNEWTCSFQNCELVQFVQSKDLFNLTSSWMTDPSLLPKLLTVLKDASNKNYIKLNFLLKNSDPIALPRHTLDKIMYIIFN